MTCIGRRARGLVALTTILFAVGCGRDAGQHLAAGLEYEKAGKLREASLEYRNAVDKDPALAEARLRLAEALLKSGDGAGGLRELVRAADAKPDDLDLQVRVGQQLLRARQFEGVRVRADKVLAKAPTRADAIVLRASALAGLSHIDTAVSELKEALQVDPKAALYTNLGVVQLAGGNRAEAEAAFKSAVGADPRSLEARLAQANFYWSTGRPADAETALKAALSIDPKHVGAARALALLYMATKRATEAEPLLTQVATATGRASDRLDLADYYLVLGRTDDALTQLNAIAADQRMWSAARARRALIEQARGKHDEALVTIGEVLVREPRNVDALVTRARVLLAADKVDLAETVLRSALDIDARHVGARYLLGTIDASRGRLDAAAAAFTEVLANNPRAVMAQVQLARLDLLRGRPTGTVERASEVLRSAPGNPTAQLLLVQGQLAQRRLDEADKTLTELVAAFPKAPAVQVALGRLRLAQGRPAQARAAFEKAAAAGAGRDALTGLVSVDVAEGKVDAAAARIAARLAAQPRDSAALLLGARVDIARRDLPAAERQLRQAIEADAGNFAAYGLLADLYVSQGKLDQARQELEALATRQPNPVAAHTMIGVLLQAQGKVAEARQRFEKVLQLDRRAPVAANNLAWIYAESGQNLGAALDLAQVAKAGMPRLAEVNDTLGFVYLKRDVPSLAVPPLREAVAADPDNPVYRFRLAQALARSGQPDAARRELEAALKLKADFPEADEARRLLKTLG
jgi:tetratricopeptide (TPR) repeat protein